jgi:plasmid replication initiation protein
MDKFPVYVDMNVARPYKGQMKAVNTALVVKSNALINAMFDLSLQGNRFLAFAISLLDRSQPIEIGKSVELEVPVKEFAETFGLDLKSAYREIEVLADQLQRKIITLQPDQSLNGRRVKVGIITKQEYLDGEGRVWLRFDEDLVPHLLGLKAQFTQYRIKDVYQFSKASSWRVYELLKQFKDIGQREFEVEEFKRKVGVADHYKVIADLRKRVIDPAIAEINAASDILVQYEQKKRGRRITKFLFLIFDNDNTKTPREKIRAAANKLDTNQDNAPDLSKMLQEEYRVSDKQALQIANLAAHQHSTQRLYDMLPTIKARFEKIPREKRTTSLGGYVFKALKDELTPKQAKLPLGNG